MLDDELAEENQQLRKALIELTARHIVNELRIVNIHYMVAKCQWTAEGFKPQRHLSDLLLDMISKERGEA